ncbi:hypothetical protein EJ110_NYTH32793 [Nymphaea thermarum]|nr:hypothetical protein EJ110_NYTH32793 [Nymphaea thermarum]
MVACELSKFLSSKGKDVIDLILGESSADLDILSSLITSLLKGCAEESRTHVGQRLKLVSADCLGAVGAVDPAKFKTASCQRFKIECSDDDLIFELIHEHLTRVFRAVSDTIVQDSAALAIQELLKLAGCPASLDGSDLSSTSQHSKGRESQENSVKGTSTADWLVKRRKKVHMMTQTPTPHPPRASVQRSLFFPVCHASPPEENPTILRMQRDG